MDKISDDVLEKVFVGWVAACVIFAVTSLVLVTCRGPTPAEAAEFQKKMISITKAG